MDVAGPYGKALRWIFLNKMGCNKEIPPTVFDENQLKECRPCDWASDTKSWCGLFGIWIKSPSEQKPSYPPVLEMVGNLVTATGRHILSGLKNRTEEEQNKCREICQACDNYVIESRLGPRCTKCGCCTNIKTRWATAHCPLEKW